MAEISRLKATGGISTISTEAGSEGLTKVIYSICSPAYSEGSGLDDFCKIYAYICMHVYVSLCGAHTICVIGHCYHVSLFPPPTNITRLFCTPIIQNACYWDCVWVCGKGCTHNYLCFQGPSSFFNFTTIFL